MPYQINPQGQALMEALAQANGITPTHGGVYVQLAQAAGQNGTVELNDGNLHVEFKRDPNSTVAEPRWQLSGSTGAGQQNQFKAEVTASGVTTQDMHGWSAVSNATNDTNAVIERRAAEKAAAEKAAADRAAADKAAADKAAADKAAAAEREAATRENLSHKLDNLRRQLGLPEPPAGANIEQHTLNAFQDATNRYVLISFEGVDARGEKIGLRFQEGFDGGYGITVVKNGVNSKVDIKLDGTFDEKKMTAVADAMEGAQDINLTTVAKARIAGTDEMHAARSETHPDSGVGKISHIPAAEAEHAPVGAKLPLGRKAAAITEKIGHWGRAGGIATLAFGAVTAGMVAASSGASAAETVDAAINGTGTGIGEFAKGDIKGGATALGMTVGSTVAIGAVAASVPILGAAVTAAMPLVLVGGTAYAVAAVADEHSSSIKQANANAHIVGDPRTKAVSGLAEIAAKSDGTNDVLKNYAAGFAANLGNTQFKNHTQLAQSETNFLQTLARQLEDKGKVGKATREAYASYLKDKGVDVNDPAALQKYTAELREMASDIQHNPAAPPAAKVAEAAPVPPAAPAEPTADKIASKAEPAPPVTPQDPMGGYQGRGGNPAQMRAENAAAGAPTAPQIVAASSPSTATPSSGTSQYAARTAPGMKFPAFA